MTEDDWFDVLDEYLFGDTSRYYSRIASAAWIILAASLDVVIVAAAFLILEALNFYVWLTQIRTGKLSKRAEKTLHESVKE